MCVPGRGRLKAGHLVPHGPQETRGAGTWRRKGSGTRGAQSRGCWAPGTRPARPAPFPLPPVSSLAVTLRNRVTATAVAAVTVEVNHRALALTSPCATTTHRGQNSSS